MPAKKAAETCRPPWRCRASDAPARLATPDVSPPRSIASRITSAKSRPSRTAHTRTASPTPFSDCSPRSSKRTPADVRASDRTVSDTSTSPAAESPAIREEMFTAPP